MSNLSSIAFTGGTTEKVLVKSGAILAGQTNFTIACWMKIVSNGGNGRVIYCERAGAGSDILKLQLHDNTTSKSIQLTYRDDGGVLDRIRGAITMTDGLWHTVGVTKIGTAIQLYVDGATDTSGTLLASNTFTNVGLTSQIGQDVADTASNFNGKLDEVRLWTTGLTSTQMAALSTYGTKPSTPVGEWLFEEGSGTTTADTGSGGNTGTITAATFSTTDVPPAYASSANNSAFMRFF